MHTEYFCKKKSALFFHPGGQSMKANLIKITLKNNFLFT